MIEFTVKQAAIHTDVTYPAITHAIRHGKLKASRREKKWVIKLSDLEEYTKNRYKRQFSTLYGNLIFDKEKGLYSATEAAKVLGCNRQHVYHALRTKKLACHNRHKHTWIIHLSDINNYKSKMKLNKKTRKLG